MEWINLKLVFSVWVLVVLAVSYILAVEEGIRNPLKWLLAGTVCTVALCATAGVVIGFFHMLDVWVHWVFV